MGMVKIVICDAKNKEIINNENDDRLFKRKICYNMDLKCKCTKYSNPIIEFEFI